MEPPKSDLKKVTAESTPEQKYGAGSGNPLMPKKSVVESKNTLSSQTEDSKKVQPQSEPVKQPSLWDRTTNALGDLYERADIPGKLNRTAEMISSILPEDKPQRPAASITPAPTPTPTPPPRPKDLPQGSAQKGTVSTAVVGKSSAEESKVKTHPMQPSWMEKLRKSVEPYMSQMY